MGLVPSYVDIGVICTALPMHQIHKKPVCSLSRPSEDWVSLIQLPIYSEMLYARQSSYIQAINGDVQIKILEMRWRLYDGLDENEGQAMRNNWSARLPLLSLTRNAFKRNVHSRMFIYVRKQYRRYNGTDRIMKRMLLQYEVIWHSAQSLESIVFFCRGIIESFRCSVYYIFFVRLLRRSVLFYLLVLFVSAFMDCANEM